MSIDSTINTATVSDKRISRCFCSSGTILHTQRICNNEWAVDEPETHSLACGHGVHDKCEDFMRALCRELQRPFACPECGPNWTRPRDLEQLYLKEKNNPFIRYAACFCSDEPVCYDIRLTKNIEEKWISRDPYIHVLSCGHAFHGPCYRAMAKILSHVKNELNCPICVPPLQTWGTEEKKVEVIVVEKKVETKESTFKGMKSTVAAFLVAMAILNLVQCFATLRVNVKWIDEFEVSRVHMLLIASLIAFIHLKIIQR